MALFTNIIRYVSLLLFFVNTYSANLSCENSKHYDINLDFPKTERWNEVIRDYQRYVSLAAKVLKKFVPSALLPMIETIAGEFDRYLPQPFADELRGIAEKAGVPLGEMVIFNLLYSFSAFGCTSIVAESDTGQIWHGRNLDYGSNKFERDILRNLTIQVDFQRNGTTVYTGSTYAGYIGLTTGQRPKAFTISLNERNSGSIFDNIYMLLAKGLTVGFLLRQVLDSPIEYNEAVEKLSTTWITAPVYYIIGGIKPGEGAVITRDRKSAVDIWNLTQSVQRWFVLETNYDHWKPAPSSDARRDVGFKAMKAIGKVGFNGAKLFHALSTRPVMNNLTTYTAIMSAVQPDLYSTCVRHPDRV